MLKNKKAIIFGILLLVYMILAIVILVLLVWFGFRISDVLMAIFNWLSRYWILLVIGIILALFYRQIIGILNMLLSKIGVRV